MNFEVLRHISSKRVDLNYLGMRTEMHGSEI
jgi:hypothetical protein